MQVEESSHMSGNNMPCPASLTPHSDDRTCHSDIEMTPPSDDRTCHSDIEMTPPSDDRTCHSDIGMKSVSDNDDTIVDSRFSEEHLQTAPSVVTNTNTETDIVKNGYPEFEDCSKTIWFSCSVCQFFFPNSKMLEEHNKMHHNHELPHICRVCATRFRSMYSLMDHCDKMHKNSKIPCRPCVCLLCKQRFSDPHKSFRKHLLCHFSDIEVQTCSICYKTERNKRDMEKHMSAHLETTYANVFVWRCKVCTFQTKCKTTFKKHQSMHYRRNHIEPLRTCEICGQETRKLRKHMIVHLEMESFCCNECGSCFKRKDGLTRHMKKHCGKQPRSHTENKKRTSVNATSTMQVEESSHMSGNNMPCPASLTPHSDDRTCHSDIEMTPPYDVIPHNDDKTCHSDIGITPHSDDKTCHSDIGMKSDASGSDNDDTIVDSRFSEKHLQTDPSGVTNTNTATDIVKKCYPEFEDCSKTIWFSCSVCRFFFPNSKTLEEHNKMHHNHELPHICHVCATRFRSMYSLIGHCEKMHKNSKILCRPCVCLLCKQRFSDPYKSFRKHLLSHFSDIEVQTCSICYKTERNKSDMEKHMSAHLETTYADVFVWRCKVCTFQTKCKATFKKHQSMHRRRNHIEPLRTCEICGQETRRLRTHMIVHLETESFCCNECGSCFKRKDSFIRHMKKHAGLPQHLKFCKICGKQPSRLSDHMLVHTKIKNFCCNICGVCFKSKVRLRNHELRHTGENLVSCAICDKLIRKRTMAVHMRCHTNERPYKCDLCDATFRQQLTLQNHKRTHNDERPFSCSVCDKRFTQRQAVSRHMLTHTGEKPYQCAVCQMRFTQKSGLKGHMRRHDKNTSDNGELGSKSTVSDNVP